MHRPQPPGRSRDGDTNGARSFTALAFGRFLSRAQPHVFTPHEKTPPIGCPRTEEEESCLLPVSPSPAFMLDAV